MGKRYAHEMSRVEGLCWLASQDGGRVDMRRERSANSQMYITEALLEGCISEDGKLTEKGWALARAESQEQADRIFDQG